jgi:hypothetical protein
MSTITDPHDTHLRFLSISFTLIGHRIPLFYLRRCSRSCLAPGATLRIQYQLWLDQAGGYCLDDGLGARGRGQLDLGVIDVKIYVAMRLPVAGWPTHYGPVCSVRVAHSGQV